LAIHYPEERKNDRRCRIKRILEPDNDSTTGIRNYEKNRRSIVSLYYYHLLNEIEEYLNDSSCDFIPYIQNIFYCYALFRTEDESWNLLRFLTFEADFSNNFDNSHSSLDEIFLSLFKKREKLVILIRYPLFVYRFSLRHVSIFVAFFSDIIHTMKEVLFIPDLPVRHLTNMPIWLEITNKESIATSNQ
jgi:hypothetical protein